MQNLDKIRILMGDEITRRTKREIVKDLLEVSNQSIERFAGRIWVDLYHEK